MLVVATWGLPTWAQVEYVREELPKEFVTEKGKERILKLLREKVVSSSPLALFEGWKKVILLSITVADVPPDKFKPEAAIEAVKNMLKNMDDEIKKSFEEAEKVVVAGSGTFGRNKYLKNFKVPFSNIIASMVLKLDEVLSKNDDDLIFLDITHGMNYHPTTANELLRNFLVNLHALRIGKRVEYAIGSSDPYRPSPERGRDVLTYHVLRVVKVEPNLREAALLLNLEKRLAFDVERKRPVELPPELHEMKNLVLKLRYPSPLYWSYILTKLRRIDYSLLNKWLEKAKIMVEAYKVEGDIVKSKYILNENSVMSLIILKTMREVAARYGKGRIEGSIYVIELNELKEEKEEGEEEKLGQYLNDIEKEIWRREFMTLSKHLEEIERAKCCALCTILKIKKKKLEETLRSNEISDKLKDKLKSIKEEEFEKALSELEKLLKEDLIPYSLLKSPSEESVLWWVVAYASEYTKDDLRNFIAHAGMEQNMTLVRKKDDKVELGYYLPMLEKLEELM